MMSCSPATGGSTDPQRRCWAYVPCSYRRLRADGCPVRPEMTPPSISRFSNDGLLIIRLTGTVDREALLGLARELNRIEADREHSRYLIYVENLEAASITSALKRCSTAASFASGGRPAERHYAHSMSCSSVWPECFNPFWKGNCWKFEKFRDTASASRWLGLEGLPVPGPPCPTR